MGSIQGYSVQYELNLSRYHLLLCLAAYSSVHNIAAWESKRQPPHINFNIVQITSSTLNQRNSNFRRIVLRLLHETRLPHLLNPLCDYCGGRMFLQRGLPLRYLGHIGICFSRHWTRTCWHFGYRYYIRRQDNILAVVGVFRNATKTGLSVSFSHPSSVSCGCTILMLQHMDFTEVKLQLEEI